MAVHLTETDYEKNFPPGLDEFPVPVNDENYIDAWLLNTAFNSLSAIETYLLLYKDTIETPLGDDVTGANGILDIDIPAARYPAGKQTHASDTNLVAGNIAKDINIFGITGNLIASTEGAFIEFVNNSVIAETPITNDLASLDVGAYIPTITPPTLAVI